MTWPIIPAGGTYTLPDQAHWRASCPTAPGVRVSDAQPRPIEGTTWQLEAPGVYYWNRKAEHGFVLVYPADPFARVRQVFDFLVGCTYYLNSPGDMTEFNADPSGYTLSLLTRPRIPDLGCGQRANAAILLLAEMGIPARTIQWLGIEPVQGGHIGMEADLGEPYRWTCVDPFYGHIYRVGWDAVDVFNYLQAGTDPARVLWHYENTMEGPEWTRNIPAESIYAEYAGAIGWGTLPQSTQYPLYVSSQTTLAEMAQRGGISDPVEYTEQQVRDTFYAPLST